MYARIARSNLPTAALEQVTEEIRARALPEVAREPGFLGAAWLAEDGKGVGLSLVLVESQVPGGPTSERWDVLAFAGRLGGEWCLAHRLDGDALPSVVQVAVDRAVASSGTVGALGLLDPSGTVGLVYTFSEQRFPEEHGGTLYRVLTTA